MPYTYYIGQGCAFIAWIMVFVSYHFKRESSVILFHIIAALLYMINYWCLGALLGVFIMIIELIKSILYYKTDKDKYIFFYTLPIYLILIIIFGLNLVTLVATFGSIIDGYALLKDKKTMVFGGIIAHSLWIIYDLFFMDYAGVFTDSFVILSNLYITFKGYTKFLRRDNVYTVKPLYISKATIRQIGKLDQIFLDKQYRWSLRKINDLTKNKKYSYILIKDGNNIIGYVNFLNLEEDTYKKLLKSNVFHDVFTKNEVHDFKRNMKLYLNLNAIVLSDEYDNSDTINKIERAIKGYIKSMKKNGYDIQEICCYAVTHLEFKVLEEIDFKKVKNITNECFLYRKVL